MLSKQPERLIALAHGEAALEPLMRPTSAGGNRYILPQSPQPEFIDTPNIPRPVLQVPLPPKKRFPRETSPNTQRVKPACARQLFPPEERDKEEEVTYWKKTSTSASTGSGTICSMDRTQSRPSKYCAEELAICPSQNEKALMKSINYCKSFPVNGINKQLLITLLTVLQKNAPTQIQISEFDLDEES
jgi:hypothetical protein